MPRTPAKKSDDGPGATVSFQYDRRTVERFRKQFPRARWRHDLKAWFVPGTTAVRRFNRWLAQNSSGSEPHAEAKGRDAFSFDPIDSKYLLRHEDRLEVDTPYSLSIVEEMRGVPFAAWDSERRVWTIPYRSYDALRRRWPLIEAAARRNEPEERHKRREARRGSNEELLARARAAERRRHRYPLDPEHLPPLDRPVMTATYGPVVFTSCSGEVADPQITRTHYSELPASKVYVWGQWRRASFGELVKTWPARTASRTADALWWQPTMEELRPARKAARSIERRRARAGGAS